MPGSLTVVARSGGREYRTRTSDDGVYEFHGISPGEYYLRVEAPADRVAVWSGGVETVLTPAGLEPRCPVDFQLFGNGRLSGTVIDGNGRPVSGIITVEYVDDTAGQTPRWSAVVKDGTFEILRLWPEQYRLAFLRDGQPTTEPVYYPGTTLRSNAVLIELREESNVGNLQFSVL